RPWTTAETISGVEFMSSEKWLIIRAAEPISTMPSATSSPDASSPHAPQPALVDQAHQPPDGEHADEGAEAAGHHHQAGGHHRIAHQPLEHGGQQRHARIEQDAEEEADHGGDNEAAVAHQGAVEERVLGGRGVDD